MINRKSSLIPLFYKAFSVSRIIPFSLIHTEGSSGNYFQSGTYILSIKWWNVKFNWYVIYDKWHIDISCTFPIKEHILRECVVVISSTGIKTCTVDIDKDKQNKRKETRWKKD